jgi:hypothetical protein
VDPSPKVGVVSQLLGGVFHLKEDFSSPVEECCARFRENGFPPKSMKQFVPNLTFKVENLLTQRWLRYPTPLRGSGEISCVGDCDEVAELV